MRKLRSLLILLILAVIFAGTLPASAQSKTLVWKRYDVLLNILPNGDLRVTERQRIDFTSGTFSFGFAVIPLDKIERIVDVHVSEPGVRSYQATDYSVEPFTFWTDQSGNELEIRWNFPPTSNSIRTFELSYTVKGGVRIYESGDKLQWMAIDNERDFPIEAASVQVTLPQGASFQDIDSAGVAAEWQQGEDGRTVQYVAQRSMSPSDTFEIGVEFTHGVIPSEAPTWQAEVDREEFYDLNVRPVLTLIVGFMAVLLAIGLPLLVYLLWYSRGRDPEVGPVPDRLSSPPSDLPAGVLGSLIDEQADMQDVVASIVDLARRGYLKIEEVEKPGLLGFNSEDFVFRRTEKDDGDLRPYERRILRGIFGSSRKERELSDLRNKFYRHLDDVQEELYKELVREGFFKSRADKTRGRWTAVGIGGLALAFLAGIVLVPLSNLTAAFPCLAVGLGLGGVALIIAARNMPVKTRKGAEAAAKWQAFRTYLRQIENLTDLNEASELFEQYLPYAIAFGMNNSWINKFTRLSDTPAPGWYVPRPRPAVGTGGAGRGRGLAKEVPSGSGGGLQSMSDSMAGGLQSMSDGLTRMLNSTGRVLKSAPSSSGTSGGGGFSGGGFSAGGGGGGGGRGFG